MPLGAAASLDVEVEATSGDAASVEAASVASGGEEDGCDSCSGACVSSAALYLQTHNQ